MAGRKGKTRDKKRASAPDVASAMGRDRPSSSMTTEVDALTADQLVAAARGANKPLPPAPPTTVTSLDAQLTDLAATVEIPSLGALGPRLLIMDAAEGVIADRGFNHTTIREVAEWAGVSVDVFHAHFADMRSLLAALCERFSDQAMQIVDDATRPAKWDGVESISKAVDFAVRGVVDLILGRAALVRAIFASGERGLIDEIRRLGTHLTIRLTRLLNERPSAPNPLDVGFAVLTAIAIAHHAAVVGPEWSGVELDREQISKRAGRAATAYIESTLRSR